MPFFGNGIKTDFIKLNKGITRINIKLKGDCETEINGQGPDIDKDAIEKFKDLNLEYPSGCIIAKANLSDCVFIDNNMREILKKKNYFVYSKTIDNTNFNGYGFVIKDVKKIKPIFINGKLSLWDYDYE